MARTKNRGIETLHFPKTRKQWNLAEYVRISKEDMNRGKDDSNSIVNQRKILDSYYQEHMDDFITRATYCDDGFTGTDSNREDFQNLIADIMSKKIDCVIVKDLSRLSRNYAEAGSLIENLFVRMNVRFISLAEAVDSYLNPDSVSSIIVPITNVMNDHYCYQISKKIRQVFDIKRRNGDYIAPFAPHGYIKDPQDKHRLIVDEEAAEVVKSIFSMFIGGTSKHSIAVYLNDHGVLTPSAYKKSKGMVYKTNFSTDKPLWRTKVIDDVLTNRLYTGDMVQGRRRVKSYKVHEIENVPEDEWVVVEDTHEAIIDKALFAKVQEMLKRDTRTAPNKKQLHLFSGFLKCPDCGKAVNRGGSGANVRYFCSTYKMSRTGCTMHSIKHNRLEAAVLYAIRQQVYLAVSYSDTVAQINLAPQRKSLSARLEVMIADKEKELAKINRYKQAVYEDWKDGEITQSDYRQMREDYDRQAATISTVIDNLYAERTKSENGVDIENPFLSAFRQFENIDKLTREIVIELVDHIKVYEGGDISIRFKFADEYRRVSEYIEANTQADTQRAAV